MNTIYNVPTSKLKVLNNLFIELTAKNCNQRCKQCYIDFPLQKNIKDFIATDIIKKALHDTSNEDIECIYFTGAEPMTHPDFNNILRLCLQRSNVCIFTNGSFINEKKARFLKRVEDESNYELIFQLSIDHYDEIKNDNVRYRGSYRQVLHAIKCLIKYDFNPILCITNYYDEDPKLLINEFEKLCKQIGFDTDKRNFKINKVHHKNGNGESDNKTWNNLDCEYGRILTINGVYACPFLANDHRGRCGSNFQYFSRKNSLETDFCSTCIINQHSLFAIDYNQFK